MHFGRIDIGHVDFVVADVCYFVLFQLLRFRPINITKIHVVSALDQLLTPVRIRLGSIDILYV